MVCLLLKKVYSGILFQIFTKFTWSTWKLYIYNLHQFLQVCCESFAWEGNAMQSKHVKASSKPPRVAPGRSSATAWADHLIIHRASPVSFSAPLKLYRCHSDAAFRSQLRFVGTTLTVLLIANTALVSHSSLLHKTGKESEISYWGTVHSSGSPTLT